MLRRGLNLISVSKQVHLHMHESCIVGSNPDSAESRTIALIHKILHGTGHETIADNDAVIVSMHKTRAGTRRYTYQWKTDEHLQRFRHQVDITGSEDFPGVLSMAKPIRLNISSYASDRRTNLQWDRAFGKLLRDPTFDRNHLVNCLLAHYSKAYGTNSIERDNISIGMFISLYEQMLSGGQLFSTLYAQSNRVKQSDPLTTKNTYIFMWWKDENTSKWTPHFAQVLFYFTHDYKIQPSDTEATTHYFAFVHWFNAIQHPEKLLFSQAEHLPTSADLELHWPTLLHDLSIYDNNPYISNLDTSRQVFQVIPVQSIAGRAIIAKRATRIYQAMMIPFDSKVHGR